MTSCRRKVSPVFIPHQTYGGFMSLPGRTIAGAPLAPTVTAVRTNSGYETLSPLTLVGGSAVATVDDEISTNGATPYLERIAIRLRNRILFLETREIAWLE